ncbi:hypothetical protein [Kineococcus glutinatus]|uniref:Integral membrane protein n=1 Tax=Kineococcus glutinatus TaxID=1070872 RepID=A0ABP9HDY6_9ACTN
MFSTSTPSPSSPTVQIPNPAAALPPGAAEEVALLLSWLKGIGIVGGAAGLVICGIMMTVGRRNRSAMAADGAAGIPWVLGGISLVSFGAGVVGAVVS